jgi:uncharacterized protein
VLIRSEIFIHPIHTLMKTRFLLVPFCLLACSMSAPAENIDTPAAAPSDAAAAGDAEAMFQSARKLLRGEGVEKDERKGFELVSKAAALGHVEAMANLGYLYSAGVGTPADQVEAARWFRMAAEKNHAISQLNLARLLLAVDKLPQPANKEEEKARWAEGAKWLQQAADQGLSDAQSSYGLLLLRGDADVKADPAAAARYLMPAAKAGIPEAMNALATMYQIGNGVPTDTAETERLFREAAMAGNAKAQANLGLFLENKAPGDPAVRAEGLAWLLIAEIGRDPVAIKTVAIRLNTTNPDEVAAARKKSAELRRAIHRYKQEAQRK